MIGKLVIDIGSENLRTTLAIEIWWRCVIHLSCYTRVGLENNKTTKDLCVYIPFCMKIWQCGQNSHSVSLQRIFQ